MDQSRVSTVKEQIRSRIVQDGLEPESAAKAVLREFDELGVPDIHEIVPVALEEYRAELHKIEYLQVATIPRRRRKDWYGGPTANGIWAGLKKYLLGSKGWAWEDTVKPIDETSSKIISLLDNPGTPNFSTRSLVVGYVQSGKTANMTAVAAKAVDANYKFVIILAGMTDALRSQTQARIESDLIDQNPDRWHRWTTIDMDFVDSPDVGFPAPHPASRHIAVIKKNKWVLQRFLTKLLNTPDQILRNIPFLVVDDECDQASVNAARYRNEVTQINDLIRRILHRMSRSAYIGYTATPFANVLIDPTVSVDRDHPDDLYPSDFIVALPRPANYFGAETLFGRGLLDADDELPDSDGLDMIRVIEEEETEYLRPVRYQEREDFNLTITDSLDAAIRYYLMASAARCARGQTSSHSCMLVHTTVYVAPHFDAKLQISEHLQEMMNRLRTGDKKLETELTRQWESEECCVDSAMFGNERITFDMLLPHLADVMASVGVVVENGVSDERLDFSSQNPCRYIVVGGSVLARGLTIEGLVVSFFLRTSSQYDSLMQMGRWFGYRPGYEDFPRVWMTRGMRDAFKELATVEAEIRGDIEVFRERDITPLDFAVRIRQIPGMSVTAKNKMLASQTCDISYSTEHIQTTRFRHRNETWLTDNWETGGRLLDEVIKHCGQPESVSRGRLSRRVPVGCILRFISSYRTHESHRDFQASKVVEYIESQNERGEECLAFWNVGIVEPSAGQPSKSELGTIGKVRTVIRSLLWDTKDGDADIKALMSRGDILIDCSSTRPVADDSWRALKARRTEEDNELPLLLLYPIEAVSEPSRSGTRTDGKPTRAALNASTDVLGVGIVFPESPVATADSYVRVSLPDQEFEEAELVEIEDEEAA